MRTNGTKVARHCEECGASIPRMRSLCNTCAWRKLQGFDPLRTYVTLHHPRAIVARRIA
jgi:anaerobic ribonucleoside-triphosphate reductase